MVSGVGFIGRMLILSHGQPVVSEGNSLIELRFNVPLDTK